MNRHFAVSVCLVTFFYGSSVAGHCVDLTGDGSVPHDCTFFDDNPTECDATDAGYNASEVCCSCGGGVEGVCTEMLLSNGEPWFDAAMPTRNCQFFSVMEQMCNQTGIINEGMTPLDACCECGGGKWVPAKIVYSAAPTDAPPTIPPTAPFQCVDLTNNGDLWFDSQGRSCGAWYSFDAAAKCAHALDYEVNGEDAWKMCCVCGGGESKAIPYTDAPATTTPQAGDFDNKDPAECVDISSTWSIEVTSGATMSSVTCAHFNTVQADCLDAATYKGVFSSALPGPNVADICCACGGGRNASIPPSTYTLLADLSDTAPYPDLTLYQSLAPGVSPQVDYFLKGNLPVDPTCGYTYTVWPIWFQSFPENFKVTTADCHGVVKRTSVNPYQMTLVHGSGILPYTDAPYTATPDASDFGNKDPVTCKDLSYSWAIMQTKGGTTLPIGCGLFNSLNYECLDASTYQGDFIAAPKGPNVADVCCACGGGRNDSIPRSTYTLSTVVEDVHTAVYSDVTLYKELASGANVLVDYFLAGNLPVDASCAYTYTVESVWFKPFPENFKVTTADCNGVVRRTSVNPHNMVLSYNTPIQGPIKMLTPSELATCEDIEGWQQHIEYGYHNGADVNCSTFKKDPSKCVEASLFLGDYAADGNWNVRDACCACGGGMDTTIPSGTYIVKQDGANIDIGVVIYGIDEIHEGTKLQRLLTTGLEVIPHCPYSFTVVPIWGRPFPEEYQMLTIDCNRVVRRVSTTPTYLSLVRNTEAPPLPTYAPESSGTSNKTIIIIACCVAAGLLALCACVVAYRGGRQNVDKSLLFDSPEGNEELIEVRTTDDTPVLSVPIGSKHYRSPPVDATIPTFVEEAPVSGVDHTPNPMPVHDAAPTQQIVATRINAELPIDNIQDDEEIVALIPEQYDERLLGDDDEVIHAVNDDGHINLLEDDIEDEVLIE